MLHKHRGISSVGAFCERPRANTVRPYHVKCLLFYKHRIPEAEKAILHLYGGAVGGENIVPIIEGADQHQQCALGQMEVGNQSIHRLEAIAGIDENAGVAADGVHDAVLVRYALQRAAGGGTYGNDSATRCAAGVDQIGALL